ncbi:MAG TPA: DNA polymerase IV [Acidimicrobiales bacterium]|nr:DNA polymerase IV [Acidimicrobiales bacterium]
MAPGGGATILHADLDAYYASVEQLLDPSLRGRPVAVGGGVVLAASYEARACGVVAGMPGWRARRLCPGLVTVGGHFAEYQRLAERVVEVLRSFTPVVERVSIDEAFLDVAGARRLFGPPARIAASLRRRVRDQVGLPISVGVARTKHLAKIASQVAKPDGLVVVEPDEEGRFLAPLPVGLVWGVGPATRARLAASGIDTIGQLATTPSVFLERALGQAVAGTLTSLAANVDPRGVAPGRSARSVGAQAALGRRIPSTELVWTTVGYLADRVAGRLRDAGQAGRTVTVRVRFADLRSCTRAVTVPRPVSATRTLAELATVAVHEVLEARPAERVVTLLGVSVGNLVPEKTLQLSLPFTGDVPGGGPATDPGGRLGARRWGSDRAVDAVRARFGRGSVGYARVILGHEGGVPEAFRELAERPVGGGAQRVRSPGAG